MPPELWKELGYGRQPSVFASSEFLVMAGVVLASGLTVLVRDNKRAFFLSLGICVLGFALVGLALLGRGTWLSGFRFMVLIGLGLYLPYVAIHTTIFERLLAMAQQRGNVGYLLYLADSFGYLGYVGVMLGKSVLARPRPLFGVLHGTGWWLCRAFNPDALRVRGVLLPSDNSTRKHGGAGMSRVGQVQVFWGPERGLSLEELPVPEPQGAEILVRGDSVHALWERPAQLYRASGSFRTHGSGP